MKVLLIYAFLVACMNVQLAITERLRLSCDQIRQFVDGHNLMRQKVAQGGLLPRQPPAASMKYMVWDEELAEKASKWAEKGVFGHNPDRSIGSGRWSLIGENVYQAEFYANFRVQVNPNISEALNDWFGENANYGFEPFELGTEKPIGHYTQMIWADTTRVGCGIAQSKPNEWTIRTLFVCDYGPNGNFFGQLPYQPRSLLEPGGQLTCDRDTNCRKPYGSYC